MSRNNFRLLIWNSSNSDVWADNWTSRGALKFVFPRIFALSSSKQGHVSSFSHWVKGRWIWDVQLRRSPFDWERDVWDNFNNILDEMVLDESSRDRLI